MAAYNYKIIDFLATRNTILVINEDEFDSFRNLLIRLGMSDILIYQTFDEWQIAANINHRNPCVFCFEYDNSKGLTWYDNVQTSKDWYGLEPIKIKELLFEGEWSHE